MWSLKKYKWRKETRFLRIEGRNKVKKKLKYREKNKIFLESKGQEIEMVHKQMMLVRKEKEKNWTWSDEIKVMHTNIDGIIARKLELTDYLREKITEIV